jgi:hypothetical protein
MAETRKPYDQAFKSMPEASPRGFAEAMGVLDPGDEADVEILPQEVALPTVAMDVGLLIRPRGQEAFVAIFEAFARFRPELFDQVIEYNKGLDSRLGMPMRTFMVPLIERALPPEPPALVTRRRGGFTLALELEWIRPWEVDAEVLLRQGRPEFDAWTVLCRRTPEQDEEAWRRLRAVRSEAVRYVTLGGLRYRGNEAEWQLLLERRNRMLTKEDWRESLAVQEWLKEGRQEGRQQGRLEGRDEGRSEAMVGMIRKKIARFPGLRLPDPLPSTLDLAPLAEEIIMAPDEPSLRMVLRSHGLLPVEGDS